MTIKELIGLLSGFDKNTEVVIAEYPSRYMGNPTHNIIDVLVDLDDASFKERVYLLSSYNIIGSLPSGTANKIIETRGERN